MMNLNDDRIMELGTPAARQQARLSLGAHVGQMEASEVCAPSEKSCQAAATKAHREREREYSSITKRFGDSKREGERRTTSCWQRRVRESVDVRAGSEDEKKQAQAKGTRLLERLCCEQTRQQNSHRLFIAAAAVGAAAAATAAEIYTCHISAEAALAFTFEQKSMLQSGGDCDAKRCCASCLAIAVSLLL